MNYYKYASGVSNEEVSDSEAAASQTGKQIAVPNKVSSIEVRSTKVIVIEVRLYEVDCGHETPNYTYILVILENENWKGDKNCCYDPYDRVYYVGRHCVPSLRRGCEEENNTVGERHRFQVRQISADKNNV